MKKIFAILLTFTAIVILASCKRKLADVQSIELNPIPATEYSLKDGKVDLSTFTLTVKFTDNTSQSFKLFENGKVAEGVSIIGGIYEEGNKLYLDTRNVGNYKIVIMYQGHKIEFAYSVFDPNEWDGVSVSQPQEEEGNPGVYLVSSAAEFNWIVQESNKSQNPLIPKGIKLTAPINFYGKPIGSIALVQKGFVFDGNNQAITGLHEDFRTFIGTMDLDQGGTITFKNIKISNIDLVPQGSVALLALWVEKLSYGTIQVDNVEVTGQIFASGSINGGLFGYMYTDISDKESESKVILTNSNIRLKLTSIQGNTGLIIGHGNYTIEMDYTSFSNAKDYAMANFDTLNGNRGFFHGNSHNDHRKYLKKYGTFQEDENGNEIDLEVLNKSLRSQTLTNTQLIVEFGNNVKFNKTPGAVKAVITYEYYVKSTGPGNYTRIIRETIDTRAFPNNVEVVSSIKKQYISQDQAFANQRGYIFNNEKDLYPGINSNAKITIIELDSSNNVVSIRRTNEFDPVHPDDTVTLGFRPSKN